MSRINENFLKLQKNYLFAKVNKKVEEFKVKNPGNKHWNWRCDTTITQSSC